VYWELTPDIGYERNELRTDTHRFAAEVLRPASLVLDRSAAEEVIAPGSRLWEVFRAWYAMGNHTAALPAKVGGLELDALAQHVVYEELGWGACDLAISLGVAQMPFQAAASMALLTGNRALLDEVILPFVDDRKGRYIGCWAITEPNHGSDTLGVGTAEFSNPKSSGSCRARHDGSDWIVTGEKSMWVSNGSIATHSLLFCTVEPARGMAGGGVLLVPLDLPGVKRGAALEKHGQRALNQGEILFEDVRVPGHYLLAGPDDYTWAHETTLSGANSGMGVVFTGVARAAFEEALSYARARVQGGKPIAEHQMVQGKLFSMFSKVEQARALSRAVSGGLASAGGSGGLAHAIASKVACTEAAFAVASDAVQVFGAVGLAKGVLVEKLLRDARAALIEDGVNEFLALVAARQVVDSYAV
jgi:alkylation response protein AidB-like acyl-CoA dehydrogenase